MAAPKKKGLVVCTKQGDISQDGAKKLKQALIQWVTKEGVPTTAQEIKGFFKKKNYFNIVFKGHHDQSFFSCHLPQESNGNKWKFSVWSIGNQNWSIYFKKKSKINTNLWFRDIHSCSLCIDRLSSCNRMASYSFVLFVFVECIVV